MKYAFFIFLALLTACQRGNVYWDCGHDSINCETPAAGVPGEIPAGGRPRRSARVFDGAGEELGFIAFANELQVTVINEDGFLYQLYWDSTPVKTTTYHTTADCSGSVYHQTNDTRETALRIFTDFNGDTYVPAAPSANSLVVPIPLPVGSYRQTDGVCQSTSGTTGLVELSGVTHEGVGLPSTITAPLGVEGGE